MDGIFGTHNAACAVRCGCGYPNDHYAMAMRANFGVVG
jgi:hypothetical protein